MGTATNKDFKTALSYQVINPNSNSNDKTAVGVSNFVITDGQLGDDTAFDGIIIDPAGPAKRITPVEKVIKPIMSLARTGGASMINWNVLITLIVILSIGVLYYKEEKDI